ncbi:MAG: hypothetical protein NTZ53_11370 [Cyanobacteria bacterium]|nr:hypothetical protein [Cyanobacteriota bacterium]
MSSVMIARTTGGALLFAFIVTIGSALFPLELGSPEWGRRLSTLIVDASSLPLVSVALLRYAASLELNAASENSDYGPDRSDPDGSPYDNRGLFPSPAERTVHRLAQAGFIGLLLLAIWQVMLWFGSLTLIDGQDLARFNQVQAQSKALEQQLKQAPPGALEQAWRQSQGASAPSLDSPLPTPQVQRQEILARLKVEQAKAVESGSEAVNRARFGLTRDSLRIILMAVIYAWAFYGIARL